MQSFADPAFKAEDKAIARVEGIAWEAYKEGRKAPATRRAGKGFADPEYYLSVEWLETRDRLKKSANRMGQSSQPVTGTVDLRIIAQRWHLPRRDIKNMALDQHRKDGAAPGWH